MDVSDVVQYGALGILLLWSVGAYKIATAYMTRVASTLDAVGDKLTAMETRTKDVAYGVRRIEVALGAADDDAA